jgi:hypothetical protein
MRGFWIPFFAVVSVALAAPDEPERDPRAALARAAYEERARGDLAAAEQAYRDAIEGLPPGDPARADAIFRLGALLVRSGRIEEARGLFVRLFREFPDRRDLLARADQLLIATSDPPPPPRGSGGRTGRVIAVGRESGAFGLDLGTADGLGIGSRLIAYREGAPIGEALVVRALERVSVARSISGVVAAGDEVVVRRHADFSPETSPTTGGAPARDVEALRRLLERLAGEEAERRPPAPSLPAQPTATAATAPGPAVELRLIAGEEGFLGSLGLALETLPPGRPEPDALLAAEPPLCARLRPGDVRLVLDVLSGALARPAGAAAFVLGSGTEAIEAGRRVEASIGVAGGAATRVAVGLRARRLGAAEATIEVEALAVQRPPDAPPLFQRVRGEVTLDAAYPGALVGGLRQPGAGGGRGRPLFLLLVLRAAGS